MRRLRSDASCGWVDSQEGAALQSGRGTCLLSVMGRAKQALELLSSSRRVTWHIWGGQATCVHVSACATHVHQDSGAAHVHVSACATRASVFR